MVARAAQASRGARLLSAIQTDAQSVLGQSVLGSSRQRLLFVAVLTCICTHVRCVG